MSSWRCSAAPLPIRTGARVAVARPVRVLDLGQLGAPVDAVHDLQRPRRPDLPLARAVGQPAHERRRLLGEAEPQQRVERERGVADPRVAVVPVALAAELLGQRRGRRGHERAGRRVGEQLERQRRAVHHLAPAAAVARLRRASGASSATVASNAPPSRARGTGGRCGRAARARARTSATSPASSVNVPRTPRPRARAAARAHRLATAPSSASVSDGRAEQHAVRVHLDLVLLARVVEARLHLDRTPSRRAPRHAPDQPVAVLLRLAPRSA